MCVCLDRDGGVGRFATTTSTAPLFYCLRTGICFRVVAVAISANRLLGLRVFSRTLPSVFPIPPHRIHPLPGRVRPSIEAVPPPITPQNRVLGLVHEEVGLISRGGFSPAWLPSGRLRPASHVSNPKLLEEQLCAPRGAVWEVC